MMQFVSTPKHRKGGNHIIADKDRWLELLYMQMNLFYIVIKDNSCTKSTSYRYTFKMEN